MVSQISPIPVRDSQIFLPSMRRREGLQGLKLAYVGDGNNVAHSLLYGSSKVGMNIILGCPKGYEPDPKVVVQNQGRGETDRL